jgi:tRNA(adenine34) deaminase
VLAEQLLSIDIVALAVERMMQRSLQSGHAIRLTSEEKEVAHVHPGFSLPCPPKDLPSADECAAMDDAIDRALLARDVSGKAGIAASVLRDGRVIATGENEVQLQHDPTKHAEMVAISRAAAILQVTDLSGCVMISTLQPCEMCLSAMRFAGIARLVFAATQANVAPKYFVFPHLRIEDFQRDANFVAIGGVAEARILHLYATGNE